VRMDNNEWLEAGIDLETATDWFYKGFEEPERAIPWINLGIDPSEAFLWILYNFQSEEVLDWKAIGLTPDLSYSWKEVGFLPAEVSYLIYSGKSYMDIVEALRRGKTKDEIMQKICNENI